MHIIGVDPGKHGAYARIENGRLCRVVPFKGDITICRKIAMKEVYIPSEMNFFVERVTASPQMGVVSAFTFGRWAEAIDTALYISQSDVHMVRPNIWQNAIGVFSGGDKKILYEHAKKLFPEAYEKKMFNKETSDAVLIAYYGWRYMENRKG